MDLSLKQTILTPYSGLLVFRPRENHGYQPEAQQSSTPGGPEEPGGIRLWLKPSRTLAVSISSVAHPNLFNQSVKLTVQLPPGVGEMHLVIYNAAGQRVRELELVPRTSAVQECDGTGGMSAGTLRARASILWCSPAPVGRTR